MWLGPQRLGKNFEKINQTGLTAFELVIITYQNRDKIMSRADSFDEIGSEEHDEIIQSLSGSYQSNGAPMFFEHSINTGK